MSGHIAQTNSNSIQKQIWEYTKDNGFTVALSAIAGQIASKPVQWLSFAMPFKELLVGSSLGTLGAHSALALAKNFLNEETCKKTGCLIAIYALGFFAAHPLLLYSAPLLNLKITSSMMNGIAFVSISQFAIRQLLKRDPVKPDHSTGKDIQVLEDQKFDQLVQDIKAKKIQLMDVEAQKVLNDRQEIIKKGFAWDVSIYSKSLNSKTKKLDVTKYEKKVNKKSRTETVQINELDMKEESKSPRSDHSHNSGMLLDDN